MGRLSKFASAIEELLDTSKPAPDIFKKESVPSQMLVLPVSNAVPTTPVKKRGRPFKIKPQGETQQIVAEVPVQTAAPQIVTPSPHQVLVSPNIVSASRPKSKPRWGIKYAYPVYLVCPNNLCFHSLLHMFTDTPAKGIEKKWYYLDYDKRVYSADEIEGIDKLPIPSKNNTMSNVFFYEPGKLMTGSIQFTEETIEAISRVEQSKLKERTGEMALVAIYRRFSSKSDTTFILSLILMFIGVGLLYYFLWPGLNSTLATIWMGMEAAANGPAIAPALNVSFNATIGG